MKHGKTFREMGADMVIFSNAGITEPDAHNEKSVIQKLELDGP